MNGGSYAQQFNGREGETATLYERRSLNPKLRGGGFAPRHLNRWAFSVARREERAAISFFIFQLEEIIVMLSFTNMVRAALSQMVRVRVFNRSVCR